MQQAAQHADRPSVRISQPARPTDHNSGPQQGEKRDKKPVAGGTDKTVSLFSLKVQNLTPVKFSRRSRLLLDQRSSRHHHESVAPVGRPHPHVHHLLRGERHQGHRRAHLEGPVQPGAAVSRQDTGKQVRKREKRFN